MSVSEQESCYSNDEQYFMDLCRGNQLDQIRQLMGALPASFNWGWSNYTGNNFMHMIAANNLVQVFDYLLPILKDKCHAQQIGSIINKQDANNATPLHFAVITDSKHIVYKLLQNGANTQLLNEQNRTPLQQAQKFQKFQIAQILAPLTKTDIEQLKNEIADMKLNNEDSDSDEEVQSKCAKQMDTIQQTKQEHQKQQAVQKREDQ